MMTRLSTRVTTATCGRIRRFAGPTVGDGGGSCRLVPPAGSRTTGARDRKELWRGVHIVVMGCGRVGASLALQLARREYSVAVIDQDPLAFRRLGENFDGRQVKGV